VTVKDEIIGEADISNSHYRHVMFGVNVLCWLMDVVDPYILN